MSIVTGSIEANGWVLSLTLNTTLGTFSNYALTPDATAKLVITSTLPGYDTTAGNTAIANNSKTRTVIATIPLRKPSNPSNAGVLDTRVIDETDLGGGQIRVRIALSNWIYSTDTNVSLNASSGWRTGESNASVSLTNNSTISCPKPISRWADVPYKLIRTSTFDIESLVFGFFPIGNQPVAGVKYTVTDGTNTVTVWSTSISSSTQYGDSLRCHRVTIDPSTATPAPLTPGVLRVDRTVYPFYGSAWTTDPAGTKAMPASFNTDAYGSSAVTPFAVCYDPTGVVYPFRTAYIDYVNGTTTAAAGMVATGSTEAASLTAAKAISPTSRPKDVQTAIEAARLALTQIPANNGQAQSTFGYGAIDGVRFVLAPQTHNGGLGSSSVGFAPITTCAPIIIEGDPADSNPRVNCVVNTNSAASDFRGPDRAVFKNASIKINGSPFYLWIPYWHFDNVTISGQSGFETGGASLVGGSVAPGGKLGLHFTRTKIWRCAASLNTSFGAGIKLIRNSEWVRNAASTVVCTSRLISEAEDSFIANNTTVGTTLMGTPLQASDGDSAAVYDGIMAYNTLLSAKGRTWNAGVITVGGINQHNRQVLYGNVMEGIGPSSDCLFSTGEQEIANTNEMIIDQNTTVGVRCNLFYNDSSPAANVSATDSQTQNSITNIRLAGNALASHFTKHDRFDDPGIKSQRNAASDPRNHGYRPYNINGWAGLYGVGQRDNVNLYQDVLGPGAPDGFRLEYSGLNSRFDGSPIDPKWTNDQSKWRLSTSYPNAAGNGDYTPLAGSPVLSKVTIGNSDVDYKNVTLTSPWSSGAINAVIVTANTTAPSIVLSMLTRMGGGFILVSPNAGLVALSAYPSTVSLSNTSG